MKKVFLLLFTLASVMCYAQQNSATYDSGVVINGVRWATRNVDAPGTFVTSPENPGMFFQWGRRQGWAATGDVTGWNNSMLESTTWKAENDPCPAGWRVPTDEELLSLGNVGGILHSTANGILGYWFGYGSSGMFIPIAGMRDDDGELFDEMFFAGIWVVSQIS